MGRHPWPVDGGLRPAVPPRCVYCGGELLGGTLKGHWDLPLCSPCLAGFGPADWHGCGRCGGEVPDGQPAPEWLPTLREDPSAVRYGYTLWVGIMRACGRPFCG